VIDRIRKYKVLIIAVSIITGLMLVILSIDAIYEVDNWSWFNIDFDRRDHIVSAYGALIGGVLAFLSILFVIYQVLEQREQILQEKLNAKNEYEKNLKDRLTLLSSFLKSLIGDIISHGERMEVFFTNEKTSPSNMNTIYFNTNKNFSRVIEMDNLSNFKAFQLYFDNKEDWENLYLNLYNLVDFYSDAFIELKEKYNSHIRDKVKEQKQIGYEIHKFLNKGAKLVDDYLINYGVATYLNYPWSSLINSFTPAYYNYLQNCANAGKVPDLRHVSDFFFQQFIQDALNIRNTHGYDGYGSRELVESASYIRKKVNEVEVYSIQYADDIEKQFTNYFSQENANIKSLQGLKDKIDLVLKKKSKND